MATIEIRYHDARTERREIPDGVFVIGREAGDIVLGDPLVSGTHGELRVRGGSVSYADRGSSNGSFDAQGARLSEPTELSDGAVIHLGSCQIRLVSSGAQSAAVAGARVIAGRTMVMGYGANVAQAAAASRPQPQPQLQSPSAPPATSQPTSAETPPASPQAISGPAPAGSAAQHEAAPQPSPQPSPQPTSAEPSKANVWELTDNPDPTAQAADAPASHDAADASPHALGAHVKPEVSQPFGVPVTSQAGIGMQDWANEVPRRLRYIFELYKPHMRPLATIVGYVAVPIAVLDFVLGFIPVLGLLPALLVIPIGAAAMAFWVYGVVNQYVHALRRGESVSISSASAAHRAQLVPWAISIFIASIPSILAVLCLMTLILTPIAILLALPAVMLGWAVGPAFVSEGRRGADAPMRSYRVMRADWLHSSQGLAIVIIGMVPIHLAGTFISAIPGLHLLSPFIGAAVEMVVIPFATLYAFALFDETKLRLENAGRQVQ